LEVTLLLKFVHVVELLVLLIEWLRHPVVRLHLHNLVHDSVLVTQGLLLLLFSVGVVLLLRRVAVWQ
jgi:hypothetical protein